MRRNGFDDILLVTNSYKEIPGGKTSAKLTSIGFPASDSLYLPIPLGKQQLSVHGSNCKQVGYSFCTDFRRIYKLGYGN